MTQKINIIYKNNGVGLTHDVAILRSCLQSFQVNLISLDPRQGQHKPADINIFVEVIDSPGQLFRLAPVNYYIPNPEWFEIHSWTKFLHKFDFIFAKTKDCQRIFSNIVSPEKVVFTSFTSADKYDKSIERKYFAGHFAGRSDTKNTQAVYECWQKHKPKSNIIILKRNSKLKQTDNIHIISTRIEDEAMRHLMNACMFHVCPSQYEGFGHYINEARSCGAIIITTNAAPMNEFVDPCHGALVNVARTETKELGLLNIISHDDLRQQVDLVLSYDTKKLNEMSAITREKYLKNDAFFRGKMKEIFK